MAQESSSLTITTPTTIEFIIQIAATDRMLTHTEEDQAAILFRASGVMRRYIALAICNNYGHATPDQRARLSAICQNKLHVDIDYALRLAKTAEVEIGIFGPLANSQERLRQSMSTRQAEEISKLPAEWRKPTFDAAMHFAGDRAAKVYRKGQYGQSPDSIVKNYVQQRLNILDGSAPEIGAGATEKPKRAARSKRIAAPETQTPAQSQPKDSPEQQQSTAQTGALDLGETRTESGSSDSPVLGDRFADEGAPPPYLLRITPACREQLCIVADYLDMDMTEAVVHIVQEWFNQLSKTE